MNETERLRGLQRAVVGSVLVAMGLCPRLWTANRAFPTLPAFWGLPELPSLLTLALSGLFAAALLLVFFRPDPRGYVGAALLFGGVLVLFDLTRLQPWFYQALLFLAALGFVRWEEPEANGAAWSACAWIVAATYVWSGLQKANLAFADGFVDHFLQPWGLTALGPVWWLVPAFETLIGVFLFVPRTRFVGLLGAMVLHATVLLTLGRSGDNSVVLPWNVAMPIFGFLLFFRNDRAMIRPAWETAWGKAIVVLVGIMPVLGFFGLWDAYLSAALYAGRTRVAYLFFSEEGARQLPARYRTFLQRRPDRIGLDVVRWSLGALNVPPYPEVRAYRALARRLREAGVANGDMMLMVSEPMGLADPKPKLRVFTSEDPEADSRRH